MKTLVPWIVVLILFAALGLLFSAHLRQGAELARHVAQASELEKQRASEDSAAAPPANVAQLQKDHEDLIRLRNEVRQLRQEKDQLTKQLQTAQQSAANPQQQAELQTALTELQKLRNETAQAQQSNQAAICISNLRQIDAAKIQWAAENNRPAGTLVGSQDLAPYFANKTFPLCPAGGAYSINVIGQNPTCNLPGHAIPR